jgi:hypothetical protein
LAKFSLLLSFVLISVILYFLVNDSDIESEYDPGKAEQQWLQEVLPQAIDWVRSQEGKYILEGQHLTDREMAIAKSMGVLQPDRIRIIPTEHFPMPAVQPLRDELISLGFDSTKLIGLTLGYTILINLKANQGKWLLSHEFVHVTQYERMGLEIFLEQYLLGLKKFG